MVLYCIKLVLQSVETDVCEFSQEDEQGSSIDKLSKISFQKRVYYKNKLSFLCFVTFIMCICNA